ncbi:hypothetical protein CDAR_256671 [Caerostris darwini]|uniref:Uncharacterized protein n=1 Tax=Caerostris darwini TaxID=1538125 RepID=A0AAV4PXW3_9ARAC|nr:hypothetical protein CDAR_256671 [Caerostris darwini]
MRTGEQPSNNSIRAAAHARNNLVPHPYHWRVHCHARPSRRQGLAERGLIAPEIANGSRFLCLFKDLFFFNPLTGTSRFPSNFTFYAIIREKKLVYDQKEYFFNFGVVTIVYNRGGNIFTTARYK